MASATVTAPAAPLPVFPVIGTGALTVVPRKGISTPRKMVRYWAGMMATCIVYFIIGWSSISMQATAVHTIGSDTSPSVVMAERIRTALADMSAAAANAMLVDDWRSYKSWADFSAAENELISTLTDAGANVTFGENEKRPLRAIQDGVHEYVSLIAEARAYRDARPDLARTKVRFASGWINTHVIPAADELLQANLKPLEDTYKSYMNSSGFGGSAFLIVVALAVFLFLQVACQYMLNRSTRRTLNVGLSAAIVVMLISGSWFTAMIIRGHSDMRIAKADAFDSVASLYRARSNLYLMNADESIWLLHRSEGREVHETDFRKRLRAVADMDWRNPAAVEQIFIKARTAGASKTDSRELSAVVPKFGGALGEALANITFGQKEWQPLMQSVQALSRYIIIDEEIRRLYARGRMSSAVDMAIGDAAGQSNHEFNLIEIGITEAVRVNEAEFEHRIARISGSLSIMKIVMVLSTLLSAMLISGGMWLRFREYR